MTKDDLITVPVGTTLEQAKEILHRHKVEKLLVVDRDYNLKGLITVKDIQKQIKYPNACKDSLGRLRVGAALGVTAGRARPRGGAGRGQGGRGRGRHRPRPHAAGCWRRSRPSRKRFPDLEVIAGNVGTYEGAADLIAAGVAAVKVGMGPGLDLHHARRLRRGHAADHRHRGGGARPRPRPTCRSSPTAASSSRATS